MNIQKLYEAVDGDEMNSPLLTVCYELMKQGYKIKIEGAEFTKDETLANLFTDLEQATNEFNVEIFKAGLIQRFNLIFTEYHKFNIQNCSEGL